MLWAAFVAADLFLALSRRRLIADDQSSLMTMLGVAADELDEDAFVDWIRAHLQPR